MSLTIDHQSYPPYSEAELIKICLGEIKDAEKVVTDSLAKIDRATKVISDNRVGIPTSIYCQ